MNITLQLFMVGLRTASSTGFLIWQRIEIQKDYNGSIDFTCNWKQCSLVFVEISHPSIEITFYISIDIVLVQSLDNISLTRNEKLCFSRQLFSPKVTPYSLQSNVCLFHPTRKTNKFLGLLMRHLQCIFFLFFFFVLVFVFSPFFISNATR